MTRAETFDLETEPTLETTSQRRSQRICTLAFFFSLSPFLSLTSCSCSPLARPIQKPRAREHFSAGQSRAGCRRVGVGGGAEGNTQCRGIPQARAVSTVPCASHNDDCHVHRSHLSLTQQIFFSCFYLPDITLGAKNTLTSMYSDPVPTIGSTLTLI